MFFYTAEFTSPAFFSFKLFPTRLSLSWNFYLEKRSKTPATWEVVGLCLRFLRQLGTYAVASESVFLLFCKKRRHQKKKSVVLQGWELLALQWWQQSYFLCRIAMSEQQWYNFYILLQVSERWLRGIARERARKTLYLGVLGGEYWGRPQNSGFGENLISYVPRSNISQNLYLIPTLRQSLHDWHWQGSAKISPLKRRKHLICWDGISNIILIPSWEFSWPNYGLNQQESEEDFSSCFPFLKLRF